MMIDGQSVAHAVENMVAAEGLDDRSAIAYAALRGQDPTIARIAALIAADAIPAGTGAVLAAWHMADTEAA